MKNVMIRAIINHALMVDPENPNTYGAILAGLNDDTLVTVHDVTKIDDNTAFVTVSLVNEAEVADMPVIDDPAPTKPRLVVAK